MAFCTGCGHPMVVGWKYCETCGLEAMESTPALVAAGSSNPAAAAWPATSPAPGRPPGVDLVIDLRDGAPEPIRSAGTTESRRRTRRPTLRQTAVALVAIVFAAGIVALAVDDYTTRQDLSSTRSELSATTLSLDETRERLAETRSTLDDTAKELQSTSVALTSMTAKRDDLQGQLSAVQSELGGVRDSLSKSEQRVELQASQMEMLKTCLRGVSNALIDVADGYYTSALASLNAVEIPCQRSFELF